MSDSSLSTQERVIKAMANVVTDKEIQVDNTLEELGIDSLAAIEILFEVEEEFDINISGDNTKMHRLKSVRDVVDGVERLLAGEDMDFWGDDPNEEAPAEGSTEEGAAAAPPAEPKPEAPKGEA